MATASFLVENGAPVLIGLAIVTAKCAPKTEAKNMKLSGIYTYGQQRYSTSGDVPVEQYSFF